MTLSTVFMNKMAEDRKKFAEAKKKALAAAKDKLKVPALPVDLKGILPNVSSEFMDEQLAAMQNFPYNIPVIGKQLLKVKDKIVSLGKKVIIGTILTITAIVVVIAIVVLVIRRQRAKEAERPSNTPGGWFK
jgi:hypothetical protein